jgi:hypothetical protein
LDWRLDAHGSLVKVPVEAAPSGGAGTSWSGRDNAADPDVGDGTGPEVIAETGRL